jgi:hypothetical protein
MDGSNIHVVPCSGDGWVVREEASQRERGHYATREDAIAVGSALSRRRKGLLVVHELDGGIRRVDVEQGWLHLLGRLR